MTRVQFTRWGFAHDYRGAHVAYRRHGRYHLGEVVDQYLDSSRGVRFFKVRYFCGDPAPDIAASCVEVLEREWEVTP